jgi:hypothetical protein
MSFKEGSINPCPPVEPGRPRLKTSDALAIAQFLNGGGRIAKGNDSLFASEHEVIDFLATCGVRVKTFRAGKSYWGNGRYCGMSALVHLANEHRRARKLPPFVSG